MSADDEFAGVVGLRPLFSDGGADEGLFLFENAGEERLRVFAHCCEAEFGVAAQLVGGVAQGGAVGLDGREHDAKVCADL